MTKGQKLIKICQEMKVNSRYDFRRLDLQGLNIIASYTPAKLTDPDCLFDTFNSALLIELSR